MRLGGLWTHERGSSVTEVVIVAPVLVLMLLFVAFAGRLTTAQMDVTAAARDAARAGSLAATIDVASARAESTALTSLADRGVSCESPQVRIDAQSFTPGSSFGVRVSCTANLSDLALLGVPGTKTMEGSAREVIDVYGVRE